MTEFRVRIEIDVEAAHEFAAAYDAWDLLSSTGAFKPVVDVFRQDSTGDAHVQCARIDLNAELDPLRIRAQKSDDKKYQPFIERHGSLSAAYNRARTRVKVPVCLPDGTKVELSPGIHNELQRLIVEDFAARFTQGAVLAYLGDTAEKRLVIDSVLLKQLKIPEMNHQKLPDVVLFDENRNWLFLIEAVTSHGPVSAKRHAELEAMLKDCSAGRVYVTAFMDFAAFKKYASDIVWESEVWIAEFPDHMIHFNGDKFLGPYPQRGE